MKWYKDEEEFFRFTPSTRPQIRNFSIYGIQIDVRINSFTLITLEKYFHLFDHKKKVKLFDHSINRFSKERWSELIVTIYYMNHQTLSRTWKSSQVENL